MAEHDFAPQSVEDARRARKQLFIKGVAASAAVVALVVALIMVEGKHEEEPAPTARTVTATGIARQPEAQSISLAEAATQALRNSSEAAELQSVVMAEQQAVASAAAAAPVVPEESEDPLGVPVQASMPKAAVVNRRESAGRLVLEQSPPKGPRVAVSSSSAPATLKSAVAAAVKAPATTLSPVAPGDFFVQVGVFANPGNAEELRTKLKAAGIPTQVETRVQVGPFNNRQDALAAQAKLKSLGMESGMVVTGRH